MRPRPIGNGTCAPRVPEDFAALMDALQFQGANTDGLQVLDLSGWRPLLEFCDLAHLTLSLAQTPTAGFPDWVIRRLETSVADNALRFERVRADYTEAAAALDAAGIPHLLLKGFAQAPDYVRDARLRAQSDLDICVREEDIPAAQAALVGLGYRPLDFLNCRLADHVPSLTRPNGWTWRGNPFDPEMPPSIDLHFCLWNEGVTMIRIPEVKEFWERRVIRDSDRFSFPTLHPVDQLAYFTLHILRNIIRGDWVIHHVYELATFLHRRRHDRPFWTEWQRTHSPRLRGLEALAFSVAHAWFSCRVSSIAAAHMEALPDSQKLWLEQFGGSALEVMFRRNKHGRILQMLLAQTWEDRRGVITRALIPAAVSAVGAPAVHVRNRRVYKPRSRNRRLQHLEYLCNRAYEHGSSFLGFLAHTFRFAALCKMPRRQYWTFFAASFFLTWACQSTSSSSTCF